MIASKIEKHFEAKVKPVTIFQRARRQVDTNVSPEENDVIQDTNPNLENLKNHSTAAREKVLVDD